MCAAHSPGAETWVSEPQLQAQKASELRMPVSNTEAVAWYVSGVRSNLKPLIFLKRFYVRETMRESQHAHKLGRHKWGQGGAGTPLSGEPMRDLIPGP